MGASLCFCWRFRLSFFPDMCACNLLHNAFPVFKKWRFKWWSAHHWKSLSWRHFLNKEKIHFLACMSKNKRSACQSTSLLSFNQHTHADFALTYQTSVRKVTGLASQTHLPYIGIMALPHLLVQWSRNWLIDQCSVMHKWLTVPAQSLRKFTTG